MSKKLFILVVLLFISVPAFAQVDTTWMRRYNGAVNPEYPAGNINTNNAKEELPLPAEKATVRLRSPSLIC